MNPLTRRASPILVAVAAATLLAACGGEDGGGGAQKTGTLKVGITDAPVDFADQVVVQFSGVELKPRDGEAFSIDFAAKRLDLLELQGTRRALLLDGETVPAGEYEWMRLKVDADPNVVGDSYVRLETGGEECEMRVPSGDQTGLKLLRGFTVGAGTITDFTIDFDLRKSVVAPPGQRTPVSTCGGQAYLLKPALRIVDNLQVGVIAGSVDPGLITAQCASSTEAPYPGNVYLFGPIAAGGDVLADDYDGVEADPNGPDPLTSAMVDRNTFAYTIGFVPAGDYRVAYTCDLDDVAVDADSAAAPTPPATAETVRFTPPEGTRVTVVGGGMHEVNFAAPGT
jgi:hypothetical protein